MLIRHIRKRRNLLRDRYDSNGQTGRSAREAHFCQIEQCRLKEWDNYQKSHCARSDRARNRVFLDISVNHALIGRIVIDLFDKQMPRTAQYFRDFIAGYPGVCPHDDTKLDYADAPLYCVHPQCKTLCFGMLDGQCPHVATIKEESFEFTHSEKGLVTLIYHGPGIGSSSFAITTSAAPSLDYKCVVFGKVTEGMDVVDRLSELPVCTKGQPRETVHISLCGVLTGEKPPGTWTTQRRRASECTA